MGKGRSSGKENIELDDWEARLNAVSVSGETLDGLVLDYLTTEGYAEAAQAFAQESGRSPPPDPGASARTEIRRAVQQGDIERAVDAVNDLDASVLEADPGLFFQLQRQRLIELVRAGDPAAALAFAQEFVAPLAADDPRLLEDLEQTVALLLFQQPADSPMAALLSEGQRRRTAGELNAAVLRAQSRAPEASLLRLLQLLLWLQARVQRLATCPVIHDLVEGSLVAPGAAEAAST
ncbi:hypothetical protein H632_c1067p0 [Helicosporidium sp. ATCC 50920]|nr:hypothetical protein H632_c1067p0 [Helicosporidium sp. ATCC 50920]|eukprot:KDD74796.1 hypothetical protein H632_c1067p0 [Helicosporidium sp. ATCC 50920]